MPTVTNIILSVSVDIIVWYPFSRQSIVRTNAELLSNGTNGTILHFLSDLDVILHASPMIWGGIRQPLKFPLASRAARLTIADCLPGDYNIPRNSFNSLADLHEIWHTWHWWAEAIAHQFLVEYDNSEFSVPSMGMFNDLKLFMSNVSVGHLAVFTDQFYTQLLHRTSWPWSFYLPSFSPIALRTKNLRAF